MSKNKGNQLPLPLQTGARQSAQGLREMAVLCDQYEYIGTVVGGIRMDGSIDAYTFGTCDRDRGAAVRTAWNLLLALR